MSKPKKSEVIFADRNEFELHLTGLAGVAGTIASAAFQEEGEASDIFRSACFLRMELERLATGIEIVGESSTCDCVPES